MKKRILASNAGVKWNYFNKFDAVEDKYLPSKGEGNTIAEQTVTAICKLVYRWYNDGDVFDNTTFEKYGEDQSSYANWLWNEFEEARPILSKINRVSSDADYENLLKELADTFLHPIFLASIEDEEKSVDSIYDAQGPFQCVDQDDDDDYYDEEEDFD